MVSWLARLKIDSTDFKKVSVIILILTNLVPIYGVLFMDWQVFPIMFLFWIENLIIGVSNVFKMVLSSPGNAGQWVAKAFMIPFFCVHYGIFTLVHGIFILVMFGGFIEQGDPALSLSDIFGILVNLQLGWAVLALIISHTVSFVVNYIGNGEYKKSSLAQLMQQPYGRVVILHVTILFGGFLVTLLGSPVIGLILLIVLKTFIDIKTHLKQHSLFSIEKYKTSGTTSS
jgi:hypothetical protein